MINNINILNSFEVFSTFSSPNNYNFNVIISIKFDKFILKYLYSYISLFRNIIIENTELPTVGIQLPTVDHRKI